MLCHELLTVESGRGEKFVQHPVADVADLVVNRVVQRERARIAPEAVVAQGTQGGPAAHDVEDSRGNVQAGLRRRDLGRCNGNSARSPLMFGELCAGIPCVLKDVIRPVID